MKLILSSLLGLLAVVGQVPGASERVLRDQFGEAGQVAEHKGKAVVVIVVTARRLRTVKPWEQALLERYGDLQTILIADVPDEPPPSYDRVAAKLSQRVPDGVRVLIDLERAWATELSLDTSQPNLLLLDPEGRLVTSHAGRWSPDGGSELFAAIDRLIGRP
jgi:hypothetical protein